MAKKLGILALVVCMLLCVAVVASAEVENSGTLTRDDKNCDRTLYTQAQRTDKYHFFQALPDGSQKCDTSGTVKEDGNETLAHLRQNWRDDLLAADKPYVLTAQSKYDDDYINDVIKAGKEGWTCVQNEQHDANHAIQAIYKRTCYYCGKYEECKIPLSHNWVAKEGKTITVTCNGNPCENPTTVTGEKKCSICNAESSTEETVPAPGHDWENVTRTKSCTIPGGHGDVCKRCGMTSDKANTAGFKYNGSHKWVGDDDGQPTGHKWVVAYYTSDEEGTKEVKAKNNSGVIAATSDQSALWGGDEQPDSITTVTRETAETIACVGDTAHADYYVVYKCANANCDGLADTSDKEQLAGTTKIEGSQRKASGGYMELVSNTQTTLAHVFENKTEMVKAGCVLTAYYEKVCKVCGLHVVTRVVESNKPTGHHPDEKLANGGLIHDPASSVTEPKHYYICKACGTKVSEACSNGGKTAVKTIGANCANGGATIVECDVCKFKTTDIKAEGKLTGDAIKDNVKDIHYGFKLYGEASEAALAKWTTKKEKTAVSCDKLGVVEYYCNDCGKLVMTKEVTGQHDMVMQSSELQDCTKAWVETWVCSRANCPGIDVTAGLTGNGKGGKGTDPVKGEYTSTFSTKDGKIIERRIYTAHKSHDDSDKTKVEVVKEANCGVQGEQYILCKLCGQRTTTTPTKIPATGKHEYSKADAVTPATCTLPARTGEICKICGQVKPGSQATAVADSKPNGHKFANPVYYHDKATAQLARPSDQIAKPTSCDVAYCIRTVCTVCGEPNYEEIKAGQHKYGKEAIHLAPDCEHNDRTAKVCEVCGAESEVVDNYLAAGGDGTADASLKKLGHKWGAWTLVINPTEPNKTYHQHTCTVCGKVSEAQECKPEEDKSQSKKATCVNVSVTVKVCPTCGNTVVEYGTELDPNNHDYKQVPVEGYEPTCTEKGIVVEKCPNCDAVGKTIEVKALGHAWERDDAAWNTGLVITTEPTCVADGVGHRECSICGYTTEDITIGKYDGANTAYGHTWTRSDYVWSADQLDVDVAPTCAVDGTGHYTCADCGYQLTTTIPHYDGANTPWGHTWTRPDYVWSIDQLTISKEPTCVADGEGYYECSDCGYKLVVPVPHYDGANTPYGHVWAHEAWPAGLVVNEDGTYYYQCTDCGYRFQEQ